MWGWIVAVGTLGLLSVYLGVLLVMEKRAHWVREKDLLNRIMARDYGQYVQGQIAQNTSERREEEYQELGLPVG